VGLPILLSELDFGKGWHYALSLLIHSDHGVSAVNGVSFEAFTVYSFHKPNELRMNSEITKKMNVYNVIIKSRTI